MFPSQVIESVTEGEITEEVWGVEEKSKRKPESVNVVRHSSLSTFHEEGLVSTQAIREYLTLVWGKYQSGSRGEKSAILDEICRNLGVHRKSAIRLMGRYYPPRSQQGLKGGRRRQYSDASKLHLELLWRKMGYLGPVRMKAALPNWLGHYEHKDFTEGLREELLRMSESSIRRFLSKERSKLRRKINQGTRTGVRRFVAQVPIRDLETTPSEPGHCEMDCVAHCGSSLSGEFAWTLTLTDIASGWTECEAIWAKNGAEVRNALLMIEKRLPFLLKALYCDNGSEFMNQSVIEWFCKNDRKTPLPLYRGRPYRKNDQCYVEQKNYTHVRQLFGYGRISWQKAVVGMNKIYRNEWHLLQNYFLPQQKLTSKQRIGSKIKRQMDSPKTPFERLRPMLYPEVIKRMDYELAELNPFSLRKVLVHKTRMLFGYLKEHIHRSEWGKMVI